MSTLRATGRSREVLIAISFVALTAVGLGVAATVSFVCGGFLALLITLH